MQLTALTAISPIDGRYRYQLQHLDKYFSEFALIKWRVYVDLEYVFFLNKSNFFKLQPAVKKHLQKVYDNFSLTDAEKIKEIEKTTNHDVKAVEYFLKDEFDKYGAGDIKEWIHFGLTSQDINNTALPLLWKAAIENE
jgi:adenylosuccinate lyase